jgi:hypothetical protein
VNKFFTNRNWISPEGRIIVYVNENNPLATPVQEYNAILKIDYLHKGWVCLTNNQFFCLNEKRITQLQLDQMRLFIGNQSFEFNSIPFPNFDVFLEKHNKKDLLQD